MILLPYTDVKYKCIKCSNDFYGSYLLSQYPDMMLCSECNLREQLKYQQQKNKEFTDNIQKPNQTKKETKLYSILITDKQNPHNWKTSTHIDMTAQVIIDMALNKRYRVHLFTLELLGYTAEQKATECNKWEYD
jgi:DNA-directed RNA polymerase subunit RPC12/RpoP